MRLIDADELVKQGYEIVVDGLQYCACNKSIDIDDIPTAYDIDKFANRLKEKISNNVMTQTFGLRGKDIFYLIDETLNELKDGAEKDEVG